MLDVQSPRRQQCQVHLPRLQALRDANAGRFAGEEDHRFARPKCRPDQLADVVQEVAVVGVELDSVPVACDSRKRGQGWHEQPTREGVVDRADQIRVDARFQHVAVRAGLDGRGDEIVVPVHRQEDDSGFRAVPPELFERLKAIELGHRDVQHGHVGPEAPGQVERLTAIARKGHDVKRLSKKAADTFQKGDVIVGDEDAGSGRRGDVQCPTLLTLRTLKWVGSYTNRIASALASVGLEKKGLSEDFEKIGWGVATNIICSFGGRQQERSLAVRSVGFGWWH